MGTAALPATAGLAPEATSQLSFLALITCASMATAFALAIFCKESVQGPDALRTASVSEIAQASTIGCTSALAILGRLLVAVEQDPS